MSKIFGPFDTKDDTENEVSEETGADNTIVRTCNPGQSGEGRTRFHPHLLPLPPTLHPRSYASSAKTRKPSTHIAPEEGLVVRGHVMAHQRITRQVHQVYRVGHDARYQGSRAAVVKQQMMMAGRKQRPPSATMH